MRPTILLDYEINYDDPLEKLQKQYVEFKSPLRKHDERVDERQIFVRVVKIPGMKLIVFLILILANEGER